MEIRKLFLHRFRSYTEGEAYFSPGINLVSGENGQGKTNLLEALHFCCLGHSPRTRKDKEMIAWDAKDFILRMEGENLTGIKKINPYSFFQMVKKRFKSMVKKE